MTIGCRQLEYGYEQLVYSFLSSSAGEWLRTSVHSPVGIVTWSVAMKTSSLVIISWRVVMNISPSLVVIASWCVLMNINPSLDSHQKLEYGYKHEFIPCSLDQLENGYEHLFIPWQS